MLMYTPVQIHIPTTTPTPLNNATDSGVDAAKCLHALLTLYARLRSHRGRLAALIDRLTALCLQELDTAQQQGGEGENAVPPSPLLAAVCAVMAKSTPALNVRSSCLYF